MNFTKNHTQLTDEDLNRNKETKPSIWKKEKETKYFVNGVRYQNINGQLVEISLDTEFSKYKPKEFEEEDAEARFLRHMESIRKAQAKAPLKCEAIKKERTGKVEFTKYTQGKLL